MINRIGIALCCLSIICIVAVAQSREPTLITANIPKYPPLARQARVEGVVKLTFTLPANTGIPAKVEVLSGHPMLKTGAIENVKTWKFANNYAVDRKYETTFRYHLSGVEVATPTQCKVTFDSFHQVEVVADPVQEKYSEF